MDEWQISSTEIQAVENLLLPDNCHFADDALQVIRCWDSVDVSACPGSGKTTVLLAKLKLLADRMPLKNGAGICVLSHTNIAVNEIKSKLIGYANKLMSYPNYIGTIQSFVDQFVTMPYLRQTVGQSVQLLDDRTYAQHMLYRMNTSGKVYSTLAYLVKSNYDNLKKMYADQIELVAALHLRDDGALCIGSQAKPLAGAETPSVQQFNALKDDLLKNEGIIRYRDAFQYADNAIEEFSSQYTVLFSQRFQYVYVDEYQDCSEIQRKILHKLFDPTICAVTHIGDPDQAIYNSDKEKTIDWCPSEGFLPIVSTCRYNQEIANILSPLRMSKLAIKSVLGEGGLKPILIIYNMKTIGLVLPKFISILEKYDLHDADGIYKAIGAVKKENLSGIKISSYWSGFDGVKQHSEYKYWGIVDEICTQLRQGKLYRVESLICKLICRLFHYAGVNNAKTGKEHTPSSLRITLKERFNDIYTEHILGLTQLADYSRTPVSQAIHTMIDTLLITTLPPGQSIFDLVPLHFMEEPRELQKDRNDRNVFIDPIRGRHIQFDTVHGVKGETHDATLYLETEKSRGSDIGRILCYYGAGQPETSSLYDYSRKIAYVGMSRPRKLLCVAIQESTYIKSKNAFQSWDKIDLREVDDR
ncbi:MAG: UvrD-helicase domain-containing protein [Ruminiclostridium sp.]|jgi:DNA helicase-2/ATP-dependent DNA helicase PcrA|nr:UvrD-helicase domain-containing protein [Ruminiclostridium sp.]